MNIIFISNEFQTGGATKSLLGLIKILKTEYDVNPIVLINNDGYLFEMCKKNNIKCIKLPYKSFVIGSGSTKIRKIIKKCLIPYYKVCHYICNLYSVFKIKKLIDMNEISIIHTNTNRDDLGAILSKKYNIPHIWHIREFGSLDYECIYLRKKWINYMNNNCTCFVAISKAIKKFFVEKGLLEEKIKVIYNGIHINPKNIVKEHNDVLKIIFAGGITPNKGQAQLIDALDFISDELKRKIHIDFYGNGTSSYLNFLKQKVIKKKLTNIITFNNYCNDLDNRMLSYDVGIMCSRSEAFGRVTVEYMGSKLITIASDTGANTEIIKNGFDGFLYEYDNSKDLAKKIKDVYDLTHEERNIIINNAFEKVKNNFSDVINANNIHKLYLSIKK